ncbi:hypothetical protein FHG87_023288, partial [Trinorchestia longiramus]
MLLQCVGLSSLDSPDGVPSSPSKKTSSNKGDNNQNAKPYTDSLKPMNLNCDDPSSSPLSSLSQTSSGVDSACNSLDGLSSLDSNTDSESQCTPVSPSSLPIGDQRQVSPSPALRVPVPRNSSTSSKSPCPSISLSCAPCSKKSKDRSIDPLLLVFGSPPGASGSWQGTLQPRLRTHRASTFSGYLPKRSPCHRIDEICSSEC